jgi:hypothetical protein
MTGRLVRTQHYDTTDAIAAEIAVQDLEPGTYTLLIRVGNTEYRKLVQKI